MDLILHVSFNKTSNKANLSMNSNESIRLQDFATKVGVIRNTIVAHFDDIHFRDHVMAENWYNGEITFHWLTILANRLDSIQTNAFRKPAFTRLHILSIQVKFGSMKILDGAFNGFQSLETIQLNVNYADRIPTSLFDPMDVTIWWAVFNKWPADTGIRDVFTKDVYRNLAILYIGNTQLPSNPFRRLAASNFTTFRRLVELYLINCGIEVIAENAFRTIAKELLVINLTLNRIKHIDIDTFRLFFETKNWIDFRWDGNGDAMECTCRLLELDVIQCPFRSGVGLCVDCVTYGSTDFSEAKCGISRDINHSRLCVTRNRESIMRIVNIRMTYVDKHSISIETNFTSKIRVLFVSLHAMRHGNCAVRTIKSNWKCLNIYRQSNRTLQLNEFDEFRDTELISITAIPYLFIFGAKPLHLITIRQKERFWYELIWTGIVSIVLGVIVGSVLAVCAELVRGCVNNGQSVPPITKKSHNEYSSAETGASMDTDAYDEIGEYTDDSNYIEIVDDIYMTVE